MDVEKSKEMVDKIDKTLKRREQLRRLEEYVGGRPKTVNSLTFDDGSEDVNPFGGGNPLLTKETELEPIIWDIGDEEEEYPFVNKYLCFQEEPIMLGEEESCPVYDIDNEEEKDGDEEEVIYADYEEALLFDNDQYEEEIVSGDVGKRFAGKGFVDNYLNFQKDKKECDHSFIFKEDIVLQRILMGTDVVKNVNKNNASHAVLFEAPALVMHLDSEKEMMCQCVALLGKFIAFDLIEGQIGFVLPTIVPPCDINYFTNLVSFDTSDQVSTHDYNTCIVLSLKSKSTETSTEENIKSMFPDLHPSLLLFLHRLQCIKFRDMLNDSFVIIRKQITGNGLTNVSIGNETLTWFVDSRELQTNAIRNDVKITEISVAFALEVSGNGNYIPKLDQHFPGFKDCLGKGISVLISYVPLLGEVHGFFASLPRMIISKLCTSKCLLREGENEKWNHLGLGYLNKDIVLSVSLARALGIKSSGPKILVKMLSSLCRTKDGLTTMGHKWQMLQFNRSGYDLDEFKWFMGQSRSLYKIVFNLRIVNPAIFDGPITNNLTQMLSKVGVQWVSEHEIVKAHVLPAICDKKNIVSTDLIREHLSFIMVHLQSIFSKCRTEREDIISEVYKKAYILTNHGFVLPSEVEIHFGNNFGNHIDICRFISGIDEVVLTDMMWEKESIPPGSTVTDWESRELVDLLAKCRRASEDEENSRTSFSQAGEDDAGTLDRNVNLVEYLEI
ncbi:histidine kinase-like ATPase, C-terminal domain-containing protein [Tanacetum coccineum]